MKLAVVTASVDPEKTKEYWHTWRRNAEQDWNLYMVLNGEAPKDDKVYRVAMPWGEHVWIHHQGFGGVVPMFRRGVQVAISDGADVIACLHDDVAIYDKGWDTTVEFLFALKTRCILAGFGGALGLGDSDIYRKPYSPMQLARQDFISNMRDAEQHGRRVVEPPRVACLDGFSLIGRAEFFGWAWEEMERLGVVHHFYDGLISGMVAGERKEVWLLPVYCHHAGGQTAVGSVGYQKWAERQIDGGDQGFWEAAHRIGYEELRGVLPLRVGGKR